MLNVEGFLARNDGCAEDRREFEEEMLVFVAAEQIANRMNELGINKSELALRIDSSRAHVTQLLSGSRNLTMRSLARLAWACDSRVTIAVEPLRHREFFSSPVVCKSFPRVEFLAVNDGDEDHCVEETSLMAAWP